jgi:hypothetical protein
LIERAGQKKAPTTILAMRGSRELMFEAVLFQAVEILINGHFRSRGRPDGMVGKTLLCMHIMKDVICLADIRGMRSVMGHVRFFFHSLFSLFFIKLLKVNVAVSYRQAIFL